MKPDVTTKLLLAAIAGGLWTLALRPALTPIEGNASTPELTTPALALGNDGIYVAAPTGQTGSVYRFSGKLGQPAQVGAYGK